ncbi:hypothetical protein MNV49_000743 [Pseudohyphozyma bogoriensis]|nr:hypothetical protein MNV49_000743 [Pseudohyphozyma bogoriensis]
MASLTTSLPPSIRQWKALEHDEAHSMWTSLAPFFASHGYTLFAWGKAAYARPPPGHEIRQPDAYHRWLPEFWPPKATEFGTEVNERRPFAFDNFADTEIFQSKVICPAHNAAGQHVVIRLVDDNGGASQELEIHRHLQRFPVATHPQNHCLPMLEELKIDHLTFGVFPMASFYGVDSPEFANFGEVLEFVDQVFEDFASGEILTNFAAFSGWKTESIPPFRTILPIRYYLNDFELSVKFDPASDVASRLVTGIPIVRYGGVLQQYGKDLAPEATKEERYCPFRADVYQLGHFLHHCFFHVVLRLVDDDSGTSQELEIHRHFKQFPAATHPQNHCLPMLEEVKIDHLIFGVFPMASFYGVDLPEFANFGEVLEFVEQVLEVFDFVHSQLVAHRRDPYQLCSIRRVHYDSTTPYRTMLPIRYYLNDFELSVEFDPASDVASRLVTGIPIVRYGGVLQQYGKDLAPEAAKSEPYCLFKADVYQLGHFLHHRFLVSEEIRARPVEKGRSLSDWPAHLKLDEKGEPIKGLTRDPGMPHQQNRVGSKFGGGGVAGASEAAVDRRERLRKLALETIDLAKDPYILRNHLGGLECRLCLTIHTNEGSYLAHTQGKKHQTNLARRAAKDSHDPSIYAQQLAVQQAAAKNAIQHKSFIKIGSPGYQVTKVRDQITGQLGLLFQVHYPQIAAGVKPRHRFMSAFEQHVEMQDRAWQYLLIAAEPYQTISFKIQAKEIDSTEGMSWEHWDLDTKTYSFQFLYAQER